MKLLTQPWPWYLAGPLIGLMVPLLLWLGNKTFGISSTLRHICAACIPADIPFFQYDWKKENWSLVLALGIVLGGFLAGIVFSNPEPVALHPEIVKALEESGLHSRKGLAPAEIFSFDSLLQLRSLLMVILGSFLVGFGTRWAGGCTSGHSITGLSALQWPSLVATCCFFAGGLFVSWFVLPYILQL